MSRSRGTLNIVVVLVLLVAAWQAYIWESHRPSYVLPTPLQTASAVAGNLSVLGKHSLVTVEGAALGLCASVVLAVVLALVIVRWPLAEHVILTYALLIRTLPIVGVAPIVTLVAGRGLTTSILCVMVITVFSLLVSVIQGFESVPVEIAELTEVYAASFRRRFRMSLLPGAVASILQGLRVAAPLAVLGALLAEWLDGFDGIGSLMITASADQDIDLEMAACLVAVVLSLLSFALVELATALVARRGYRIDQMSVGRR